LDETRTSTETRIEPRSNKREILLEVESAAAIDWGVEKLRLVWNRRRFVWKSVLVGLLIGAAFAFLLPPEYESYTRLMPPDDQSNRGLAMITALAGKAGGGGGAGVAGMAGDLLGVKTTGAMFVGILASRTVQDDVIGGDLVARGDVGADALIDSTVNGALVCTGDDPPPNMEGLLAGSYQGECGAV